MASFPVVKRVQTDETYDCPDCGSSLPDEVGIQTCECGRQIETYELDPDFGWNEDPL